MGLSSFYRNHMWFKQLVDQTAHVLVAMLLLLPSVWGQFWASALLIGLLRELEQIRKKRRQNREEWRAPKPGEWSWHWRRTLDVCFWVVGGGCLQWIVS